MKKEMGIILFVIGLIIGFVSGMITTTAMQPAITPVISQQRGSAPSAQDAPPESLPDVAKADQHAAAKKRLENDIKSYKLLLKNDPGNVDIMIALGNSYFDAQQYYAAIDMYSQALSKKPDMPDVIVDLGIMYRRTERFTDAIAEFQKALKISPNHPNAAMNTAIVYRYDIKDYNKAIEAYNAFLKIAPATHPMIESVKTDIKFLEDELKKK